MTTSELQELVMTLYDSRKEAREFLEYWCEPDADKTLDKYLLDIQRVFFIGGKRPRRKPSLTELNRLVSNFMKMEMDQETTARFLIEVVQTECDWLQTRRFRLSYRPSVLKYLGAARQFIDNAWEEENNPFLLKLDQIEQRIKDLFRYV